MRKANQTQTVFEQRIVLIIFGLSLIFIILEIALSFGGFIFLSRQEFRNKIAIKQKGAYRILCLGESTTAFGDKDAYPRQLEEILNRKNTGIRFSVINKGVPSVDTAYILSELENNLDRYKPDMVTAMIGVNDSPNYVFYKNSSASNTPDFFKNTRVYKLLKLISFNLFKGFKEKFIPAIRLEKEQVDFNGGKGFAKNSKKGNPEYFKGLFILGKIYRGQKKFLKAQEVYGEIIRNNPGNYQGYLELGKTLKKEKEHLNAEELFQEFTEQGAEDDSDWLELARSYRKQGAFIIASEFLRKAIESGSKNVDVWIELLLCYLESNKTVLAGELFNKITEADFSGSRQVPAAYSFEASRQKLAKAEEMFNKAIELNPDNAEAHIELGKTYADTGRFTQARECFENVIKLNPDNVEAYIELGRTYADTGGFTQAQEVFKKTIELKPQNYYAHACLMACYLKQGNFFQAKDAFRKSIGLLMEQNRDYYLLGSLYLNQAEYGQAEKLLEKNLNSDPGNIRAYIALGRAYTEQGKLLAAEQLLIRGLELFPENVLLYKSLVGVYALIGKDGYLQKSAETLNRLMSEYYNPVTCNNYKKIKKILDGRGIKLVCVQYPMCSVEPLRELFAGEKNVIFADNEGLFKEAVKKEGYKEYFTDNFAGDFGHCTRKGNSLLAENIADLIVQEVVAR